MALRHLNPHIHQHIRQKLAARRARLVRRGTPPHQRAVHRNVLLLPRLVDRRANRLIHPDSRAGTPRHRSRLAIYHRIGVPGLGTGSGGS